VDDLGYFPGGTWPSDDVAYRGYADPSEVQPTGRHRGTGQPGNGWPRPADSSRSPLGAPLAGHRSTAWGPLGDPGDGWPHVPLGGWPGRSAQPSWGTPVTGTPIREHPYAGTRPPAGYPPAAYGPDRIATRAYQRVRPRDSGPRDSGPRDSGPRDSGPRDSGPPPRRGRDGGRRSRRRPLVDSSLIAEYAPGTGPVRGVQHTARPADPPPASYGRPVPGWLPFGRRIVILPKELAPDATGEESREHRDVNGGWLRPAVFGAMDGLVTNSSLIAGIGGGGGGHGAIILTGIAGLIAGAFSIATGEYISVTSQNELTEAEIDLERRQHARDRTGKLHTLTQVFIGKGVSPNLAEAVARQISADPDRAVATHVREELGLDPDDLPSPETAAVASLLSFTVGALVPLSPFLVGYPVLQVALVMAGLFAFIGGAAVARLTGRSAALGGLRQLAAAFLATGMAYLIGHLVGGHVA
jgi:VIT1/CCC1 family predicted Fe2+/Mn2+ transporter